MNAEMIAFNAWVNEVISAMTRNASKVSRGTPGTFDAMLPYKLGWSAERAALAMMGACPPDYRLLVAHQKGESPQ